MPDDSIDHSFILKMALRNALKLIPGLRRQISDKDEDIVVLKLLREELDLAGYQIVKKPGNAVTFDAPGGDGAV